ncbi:adhesin isopeptide-forming adherence domain-containing protein, partial [Bifidobacterium margollesii]
ADLGMGAWQAGKCWFTRGGHRQNHVDQGTTPPGFDDSAESWTTVVPSVSFATRAQATFNIAGSTTPVSDLIWTGCTNIPDGTTFTGTSTLNVDTDRDGKADHTKSVTVAPKCGRPVASPTVSPKDLGVGDRWPAGFYWWDLNVPKQGRYVLTATGHQGRTDAKESWTAAASRLMTAGVTSQAANGLVADWNQQDVTRDTKFDSHASSLLIAGGTDPVSDRVRLDVKSLDTPAHRDWDTNNDGRFDGNLRFTVKTTMHLTGGKSKAKTLDYASYHSVAGGNDSGTETFSFTPADFGLKTWPAGDAWFTSQVTGVTGADNGMNVACPAGQKLVGSKTDEYRLCLTDYDRETSELNGAENIHFTPKFKPSVTSKVEASTMSDGNPPKDEITVNLNTRTVSGLKVTARADVYWTPDKGADGTALPANRKHVAAVTPLVFDAASFRDGVATKTYDPAKDPAMKNVLGRLGTGYVTYVWRIDRTDLTGQQVTYGWDWHARGWTKTLTFESDRLLDMDATVSDGWRPGREQAEQTTGWWLKVTKIGYLGHDAHGRFQPDRPAKGAVLNMQETVDQTGRTPVAGATTNTITLNNKG